jgi:hypothetical protein
MRSRVIWFFLQDCHCPRGVIKNNSRGKNIKQGSTETNQQQPTDITQKITNAHEQHKLPNNLKWTRVIRKGQQFLPIAIHLCVSIIKSGRTLIRWRAKDLEQPQIICHLGAVNQLMMSAVAFFFLILRVLGRPMGYHDNHWKKPK